MWDVGALLECGVFRSIYSKRETEVTSVQINILYILNLFSVISELCPRKLGEKKIRIQCKLLTVYIDTEIL